MELLQLMYFKEVAECEKISAAANKLYISAPSLSATIKRLETELGTELFTRTGNTITLNRQGEIFLRYVNQSLSALENGKAELFRSNQTQQHHVSIAATTSNLWVGLLSAFSLEYPQITISNTSLKLDQLLDSSVAGKYNFLLAEQNDFARADAGDSGNRKRQHRNDAAQIFSSKTEIPDTDKGRKSIIDEPSEASASSSTRSFTTTGTPDPLFPSGLKQKILIRSDRPVLVIPKDQPAASLPQIDLSDFREENFLLPVANMSLHSMALELLEDAGVPGKNLSECSYMLRRQMLLEHRGIAFSTEYTSRSEDQAFAYIPIAKPSLPQTHRIFWEAGRKLNDDEQTFLQFASAYFASGIL